MKVAIDGPAGAGKSTVARKIAEKLGILYIDTGAMYRALAWKVLKEKIDIKDKVLLRDLALRTSISLSPGSNGLLVFCDAQDITDDIRSPEVSRLVSTVAEDEGVRQIMVAQQQDLARSCDVVMDGRDIPIASCPMQNTSFSLRLQLRKGHEEELRSLKPKDTRLTWIRLEMR
ncbi:MAG: (d)CMP kinase [Chitinophagales bacterium]